MKLSCHPESYLGLIFAVIFSGCFIFYTFSLSFIEGNANFWTAQFNDLTQHLSGFNLYLSSPWQFPLLAFDGLNYPEGTRVTFVDGIPILAFILKAVLPHNIGFINPFGYWLAFCFLLQGIAAWWITRELRVKSWAFLLFLLVTFLTYPVFMDRLRHVALMSHWLVLFSIALYLRNCRLQRLSVITWSFLLFIAFYIHIYLFIMALGIYFATTFDIKQKISLHYILSALIPLIIIGVSLFIFLLPLPNNLQPENGFNEFAMNLLSPFYGGKWIQLQATLLPPQKENGFNYLGLGVIVIFLWAAFSPSLKNFEIFKERKAFFSVIVVCFLYAISNQIYFGENMIAIIHYPDFLSTITTQIRAEGRFFWLVGYAIIIFSLYKLYHQFNNKHVFSLLTCFFILVQYSDIQDYHNALISHAAGQPEPLMDYSELDAAINKPIKYIYLYPKLINSSYAKYIVIPLMRYAALHQYKLNTGFIARYHAATIDDPRYDISLSDKQNSVYIFSNREYKNITEIYAFFDKKDVVNCSKLTFGYICQNSLINSPDANTHPNDNRQY